MITGSPGSTRPRTRTEREGDQDGLRLLARLVSVLWAAVASLGVIGDVLTTTADASPAARAAIIVAGVLLLGALAAIPWRWEAAGGVLFLLAAVVPTVGGVILGTSGELDAAGWAFSLVAFGLVPLVAGGLFLICARGRRVSPRSPSR